MLQLLVLEVDWLTEYTSCVAVTCDCVDWLTEDDSCVAVTGVKSRLAHGGYFLCSSYRC